MVVFDGIKDNIHSVWDTKIPSKRIKLDFNGQMNLYSKYLVDAIRTGIYKNVSSTWISPRNVNDVSLNGNSAVGIE